MRKIILIFVLLFIGLNIQLKSQVAIGDTTTDTSTVGWSLPSTFTPYYQIPVYKLLSNPGGWINKTNYIIDSVLYSISNLGTFYLNPNDFSVIGDSVSIYGTISNKRIKPRVLTITTSSAPIINTNNYDAVEITALSEDITSMTQNLTGLPFNFQKLIIRINDNGVARSITWGTAFISKGATLPTTTVAAKQITIGFMYNDNSNTWDCIAVAQEE